MTTSQQLWPIGVPAKNLLLLPHRCAGVRQWQIQAPNMTCFPGASPINLNAKACREPEEMQHWEFPLSCKFLTHFVKNTLNLKLSHSYLFSHTLLPCPQNARVFPPVTLPVQLPWQCMGTAKHWKYRLASELKSIISQMCHTALVFYISWKFKTWHTQRNKIALESRDLSDSSQSTC